MPKWSASNTAGRVATLKDGMGDLKRLPASRLVGCYSHDMAKASCSAKRRSCKFCAWTGKHKDRKGTLGRHVCNVLGPCTSHK